MNILFITLCKISSIQERNIYTDLLRVFCKEGHNVYIMSPSDDKAMRRDVVVKEEQNSTLYIIKTGTVQKTNAIRKVYNMFLMEQIYEKVYQEYLRRTQIDLILYSTPPITLHKVIAYAKKNTDAITYLLLKDIFPQNAVDIGMMSMSGIIYHTFRNLEKKIYEISDYIGCMSEANQEYIIRNNPQIDKRRVGLSPNCLEIDQKKKVVGEEKKAIRKKYDVPIESRVYIYGGNLGKPQDIPYIIRCLKSIENREDCYFIICGNGTEYEKLKAYIKENSPKNINLISGLPHDEYDELVSACDVGLLFLDRRFTIPNFPSRLLSYMQFAIPVLACTDRNTDVHQKIEEGNFGWWCASDTVENFKNKINEIQTLPLQTLENMGENGWTFLKKNYDVRQQYKDIIEVFNEQRRI